MYSETGAVDLLTVRQSGCDGKQYCRNLRLASPCLYGLNQSLSPEITNGTTPVRLSEARSNKE